MTVIHNLIFSSRRPWRSALIATTGLCLFAVVATMLWNSGYPEWAFVSAFMAIWILIALIWSNDDHNEESGLILARIVDHNFEALYERVQELELALGDAEQLVDQAGRK
jgi:hypothetical protein